MTNVIKFPCLTDNYVVIKNNYFMNMSQNRQSIILKITT